MGLQFGVVIDLQFLLLARGWASYIQLQINETELWACNHCMPAALNLVLSFQFPINAVPTFILPQTMQPLLFSAMADRSNTSKGPSPAKV